jgi:hypothetical protein
MVATTAAAAGILMRPAPAIVKRSTCAAYAGAAAREQCLGTIGTGVIDFLSDRRNNY